MTNSNKNSENKKKSFNELVRAEEGNGFVEKIIIIALFAFVVATGINLIAGGANDKLKAQKGSIDSINDKVGGKGIAGP